MENEVLIRLDVDDISIKEGRNKRFDLGELEELANSIEANGVTEPIKVERKEGVNSLINGHRRVAACKLVKDRYKNKKIPLRHNFPITSLPSRVLSGNLSETDILVHMLISNDGKPFLPLEEAMMYKQLKEESEYTAQQIAKRIGKSVSHVSDRLAILNADDSVKEAVQDGSVTTSDAVTIVRKTKGDQDKQKELIGRVQIEGPQVVQKELLKGRLKKDQWEEAETLYDNFLAAKTHPDTTIKMTEQKIETLLAQIQSDPNLDLAFSLGQVAGAGALTNLKLVEMLNKLNGRMNGVEDLFK